MAREFEGKTALVTGASRGIGAAAAIALANSGASRLVLHYNSYKPGIESVMASARNAGAEAVAIQADLGTDPGVETFLEGLKATGAGIDILVNNAGSLVKRAKLAEFTPELFDRVMTLNVKSAWFIAQAVAPHMIERGSGVIVNVSSIAARNGGGIGATIYAAAKAAVSTITKGLAKRARAAGNPGQRCFAGNGGQQFSFAVLDAPDSGRGGGGDAGGDARHQRRNRRHDRVPVLARGALHPRPDHRDQRRDVYGVVNGSFAVLAVPAEFTI